MPEYKFIPKTETKIQKPKQSYGGWITVFSLTVFIIFGSASGGVYFYEWYLKKQISSYNDTLQKLKSRIEIASISEIINRAEDIKTAKKILEEHSVPSAIFGIIEKNTVKNNFFTSFSFRGAQNGTAAGKQKSESGSPGAAFKGEAKSYEDLAKQMKSFKESDDFSGASFSDFKLLENGDVSYGLNLTFKNDLLKF